jgi:hypothetical protein
LRPLQPGIHLLPIRAPDAKAMAKSLSDSLAAQSGYFDVTALTARQLFL